LVDWAAHNGIQIQYIQSGKPHQNTFIERFNRSYREEVLNAYLFQTRDEVRKVTHGWLIAYHERPPASNNFSFRLFHLTGKVTVGL
jgi:putative transposase